jgi:hypothetical protein
MQGGISFPATWWMLQKFDGENQKNNNGWGRMRVTFRRLRVRGLKFNLYVFVANVTTSCAPWT